VSRPEQAAWIAGFADAVIVGSALAARRTATFGARGVSGSSPPPAAMRAAAAARAGWWWRSGPRAGAGHLGEMPGCGGISYRKLIERRLCLCPRWTSPA
jgi:hypothetical protein